jgi:hypothetical protein
MKYLAWLDKTLSVKLRDQPIGRPVFLRAFMQLTADHGRLREVADQALVLAASWMGDSIAETVWQGGAKEGYISAMARFRSGQTALISSELTHGEEPAVQLLFLGQHGSLRFEDVVLG